MNEDPIIAAFERHLDAMDAEERELYPVDVDADAVIPF